MTTNSESVPLFRGTRTNCSYCGKKFGPDHNVSRKNRHIIFRVRTKFATYSGPTHQGCVEELTTRQLSPEWTNK